MLDHLIGTCRGAARGLVPTPTAARLSTLRERVADALAEPAFAPVVEWSDDPTPDPTALARELARSTLEGVRSVTAGLQAGLPSAGATTRAGLATLGGRPTTD